MFYADNDSVNFKLRMGKNFFLLMGNVDSSATHRILTYNNEDVAKNRAYLFNKMLRVLMQ